MVIGQTTSKWTLATSHSKIWATEIKVIQLKDASDRTKRKRVIAEFDNQHEIDALAAAASVRGKQSPGKSGVAFII